MTTEPCFHCGKDLDGVGFTSPLDHYVDCVFCSATCHDQQLLFDSAEMRSETIVLGEKDMLYVMKWALGRMGEIADIAETIIDGLLPDDHEDRVEMVGDDYMLKSNLDTFDVLAGKGLCPAELPDSE